MGQTWAVFRSEGNTPTLRDLLIINFSGVIKSAEYSLSRFVGMLLGPGDLPVPRLEMMEAISSASHWWRIMGLLLTLGKYVENDLT